MPSSKQKSADVLYRVTKVRLDWHLRDYHDASTGEYRVHKTSVDYVTRKGDVTNAISYAKHANAAAARVLAAYGRHTSLYYIRVEVAPNPAFVDISEEWYAPEPPTEVYGAKVP